MDGGPRRAPQAPRRSAARFVYIGASTGPQAPVCSAAPRQSRGAPRYWCNGMKVIPLAAESSGVRSMATYVEVGPTAVLIDPGATLAPLRYGLPPADEEWEALRRANDRISAYASRAQFIFVSHYHEDHFRSDPASYAGRTVLAKDPRRMVAGLQAKRAAELWKALGPHARLHAADGFVLREHGIELHVSSPLPHGIEGTSYGYVVALTVVDPAERTRFVFASDVQGPMSLVTVAYLVQQRPTLLYLSGRSEERRVGKECRSGVWACSYDETQ